jgi:hypothetical protein
MGGRSGPVLCATGKDSSNGEVAKDTANDDVVTILSGLFVIFFVHHSFPLLDDSFMQLGPVLREVG